MNENKIYSINFLHEIFIVEWNEFIYSSGNKMIRFHFLSMSFQVECYLLTNKDKDLSSKKIDHQRCKCDDKTIDGRRRSSLTKRRENRELRRRKNDLLPYPDTNTDTNRMRKERREKKNPKEGKKKAETKNSPRRRVFM